MVDLRTHGRINLNKSSDEAYRLVQSTLNSLKFKPKEQDDEKLYIHSKTKLSWLKNKFATDFRITVRPQGNDSIIDIYSDAFSVTGGADPSYIVDPFYHTLSQLIADQPPMDVDVVEIKKEQIKEMSGTPVNVDNVSDAAISVADEIAKISKLKEDGVLSEEEFQKMKNDLIDKM